MAHARFIVAIAPHAPLRRQSSHVGAAKFFMCLLFLTRGSSSPAAAPSESLSRLPSRKSIRGNVRAPINRKPHVPASPESLPPKNQTVSAASSCACIYNGCASQACCAGLTCKSSGGYSQCYDSYPDPSYVYNGHSCAPLYGYVGSGTSYLPYTTCCNPSAFISTTNQCALSCYAVPAPTASASSASPTSSTSAAPSSLPSSIPSGSPSFVRSQSPSNVPTAGPTFAVSQTPTISPSSKPTASPSSVRTSSPTGSQSNAPSINPTLNPTASPSSNPSIAPSSVPSSSPTAKISNAPNVTPTSNPTFSQSSKPSSSPTFSSTSRAPSVRPTSNPTLSPSSVSPTISRSNSPSATPTSSSPLTLLQSAFSPVSNTITTSEGSAYADGNIYDPTSIINYSNNGYGPTRNFRLYICLNAQIIAWDCSNYPPPTGALSQDLLNAIEYGFANFPLATGARGIVRFIYNFGLQSDVPVSLISQHIDQLAPILIKYKDLVLALEAGFIGAWGEWHDSTSGNDNDAARKIVLDQELKYFSGLFPILVRYPYYLITYLGSTQPNSAFGLHDDFYASDSDDGATWYDYPTGGIPSTAVLTSFGAATSATVMFVGEIGDVYTPLQTCSALDSYSYTYHVQSLALVTTWPPNFTDILIAEGCYNSFFNKIGTRIEILSAQITAASLTASTINFQAKMINAGYGRVVRARPVYLMLLDQTGTTVASLSIPITSLDLRSLLSSAPATTFSVVLSVSAGVLSTVQSFALWIPDPAPTLGGLAAYALPLNSQDSTSQIFDATTGLNHLGQIMSTRR